VWAYERVQWHAGGVDYIDGDTAVGVSHPPIIQIDLRFCRALAVPASLVAVDVVLRIHRTGLAL